MKMEKKEYAHSNVYNTQQRENKTVFFFTSSELTSIVLYFILFSIFLFSLLMFWLFVWRGDERLARFNYMFFFFLLCFKQM
jgi:hypothetical protein